MIFVWLSMKPFHTHSHALLALLYGIFCCAYTHLFGGAIIVGFSLPMLVGVIVGTYSSNVALRLAYYAGFRSRLIIKKESLKQKRAQVERATPGRLGGRV